MAHFGRSRELQAALRCLSYLTQFGLSVVMPILLCVLFAVWLCGKYGIGEWLIVLFLAVGLISAGCGFYKFAKAFLTMNADKSAPSSKEKSDEN